MDNCFPDLLMLIFETLLFERMDEKSNKLLEEASHAFMISGVATIF